MKTAIVILNWNTREYLEKFLPGVLRSAGCSDEGYPKGQTRVVVADSASTDGSMDLVKERFPGVERIPLKENYGFTGGYNRALRLLEGMSEKEEGPRIIMGGGIPEEYRHLKYDYYILLNSDIESDGDWISPLVERMDSHPDAGACAPFLHSYFEKESFEYAGAAGGLLDPMGFPLCRGRVLKTLEKDEGQYGEKNVLWGTGACLMVRASLFHALGGLDKRFFAHMEEIDLCWRMQLSGYRVTAIPGNGVYHLGGGTLPQDSPFKLRLNYRNNLLLLENNLPYTYALRLRKKHSPEKAAEKACEKASRKIFMRMVIDGCTAVAYLLKGKASFFKSVITAHGEFKKLRRGISKERVLSFIGKASEKTSVEGIVKKRIIPFGVLFPEKMLEKIHDI